MLIPPLTSGAEQGALLPARVPPLRLLYTANGLSNDLSVIDTLTLRVVGSIRVGARPWGIAVAR